MKVLTHPSVIGSIVAGAVLTVGTGRVGWSPLVAALWAVWAVASAASVGQAVREAA